MKWFSVLLLLFLTSCKTSKNVFTIPDFQTRAIKHQTIAILPANIIQPNSKLKEAAEKYGDAFQQQLYLQLKNDLKNKVVPTVTLQTPEKTNSVLLQNNLTIEQAYQNKPEELAKIFGVDALVMVTLSDKGNFTDGPAAGLSGGRGIYSSGGGNPNALDQQINPVHLDMTANLYDALDGKLIWKTYRKAGTDLPSNMDALAQYYSSWIARRFPYKNP